MRRAREPLLWALFSGGGMLSALFLPALIAILWIAIPLGWVRPPAYDQVVRAASGLPARLFLFALISLSLFHWAHRFRYTLYDGLQLYHLNQLIAALTYGMAGAGTLAALYLIWFLL